MFRTALPLLALLALGTPAFAQHCTQPYAPDIAVSATSTKQRVEQLREDVQSFIQASDVYQQCLVDAAKTDGALRMKLQGLLAANQHDKQGVADTFNAALKSYSPTVAEAKN